jgi:hypothetical protein
VWKDTTECLEIIVFCIWKYNQRRRVWEYIVGGRDGCFVWETAGSVDFLFVWEDVIEGMLFCFCFACVKMKRLR